MNNLKKEIYQGYVDWDNISLSDIKEQIKELQKKRIYRYIYIFVDDEDVHYCVYKLREENQEEKEKREKAEKAETEIIRLNEIKRYNAIKEKYNL